SARPRYAFLVLQLVTEASDERGRAGPIVQSGHQPIFLRDWLCKQLLPLSERDGRRSALRSRVVDSLKGELSGDAERDQSMIEAAVEDQALSVGRTNLSRAISDLVKAGLLSRHYAGYATNHANRGGGRHAVYVVQPQILCALRQTTPPQPRAVGHSPVQGQLFAV
ncbi:MAG: hypothetical protein ABL931_05200, partial [Usitatibacteraceae bacterium]